MPEDGESPSSKGEKEGKGKRSKQSHPEKNTEFIFSRGYDILEVGKDASDREVKKAYRSLVVKVHPDKVDWSKEVEAKLKFERITKAYEILSDPMKRKIYDKEQTLMEKSIQSNTVAITAANYDELVRGKGIWLIQVFVDWSDRCQYFSAMWEEVGNRLQGTIGVGRVNMGRDRGLATRLMTRKDVPPSVAIWDGEEVIRRLRWDFHDVSVDGITKLVAQAVSEQYSAVTVTEPAQLEAFLEQDSKVRVLFIGKASSREQILCTAAAGQLSSFYIATTSKMSIGTLALSGVKPPALLVYRGVFGEPPEVYSGKMDMESVSSFLSLHRRLSFPMLHRHTFASVCGVQMWSAIAVGASTSELKLTPRNMLLQAVSKVESDIGTKVAIGGMVQSVQSAAASFVGASVGDVVVIGRPDHRSKDVGAGRFRSFVVKAADASDASALAGKLVNILQGSAPPPASEEEASFVRALTVPTDPLLTRLSNAAAALSVEAQIVLFVIAFVLGIFVVVPLLCSRGGSKRAPGSEEKEEEAAAEEEEEEEEDIVVINKKKNK